MLETEGFEVDVASDGDRGLDMLAEYAPHVVVCDLNMPGLTGDEVFAEIRKRSAATKLILITGYIEWAIRDQLHFLSDAVVVKPFKKETLLSAIRDAMGPAEDPSRPGLAAT